MSEGKVLDFVSKRKEVVAKKKRQFERVLFQNFLGAYSEVDNNGSVFGIDIVDISKDGCLFQVPVTRKNETRFSHGREMPLRIYFTKDSYITANVSIRYSKDVTNEMGQHYVQYGCQFDKSTSGFKALESFVDFITAFSEHSSQDQQKKRVYFL